MIKLDNIDDVKQIKADLHATFETEHGKRVLEFIKQVGGWWPNVMDSPDTNQIIGRDHTRRVIGTLRTIMKCSPEQILALTKKEE